MFHCRYIGLFSCAVLFCALTSCKKGHDGPNRYSLTGEIKIDGKPIPAGEIMFEPDTSQGNSGPAGVAEIKDGRYATIPNFGTVGGPHIAVITANTGQMMKSDGETPEGWLILDGFRLPLKLPTNTHTENIDIPFAEVQKK